MGALSLTAEQQEIIQSSGDIKINAVAGSGKTTTLVEYARSRPQGTHILYLAFNKSVRLEAVQRFQRAGIERVQVETAHSLAYRHVMSRFGYTLRPLGYSVHDLVQVLKLKPVKERHSEYAIANHIGALFAYYCNSDAAKVSELDYLGTVSDPVARAFAEDHHDLILKKTRYLLDEMNRAKIAITHDFYLKKFQLMMPRLPYDLILFDEGQDASAAMLDVFLKQKATKVIVGDTHQQIYGWRYAVNSLERTAFEAHTLSTSFRFDQQMADLAMAILGWKQHLGEISLPHITGCGKRAAVKTRAKLARTNMGLLQMAIEYVTQRRRRTKIYFEGNIQTYTYASEGASLYDVLSLYNQQPYNVRDPLLRQLKNREELDAYISQTGDIQLGIMTEIVKEYGNDIPELISRIKALHVEKEEKHRAGMVFSTIHRCKGMEYDQVTLADDFLTEDKLRKLAVLANENRAKERLSEEVNLLYVAATRAQQQLNLPVAMLPEGFEVSRGIRVLKP
jgi:hypothetical protein